MSRRVALIVIPAQTGIHARGMLDSRPRGNDKSQDFNQRPFAPQSSILDPPPSSAPYHRTEMPTTDPQSPALTASRHGPSLFRFIATMVLVLAADLISKQLAFEHVAGTPVAITRDADGRLDSIPPHDDITVIPRILSLQLTLNEGAVFGIGQGRRWVFIAFSVVAVFIIALVFAKSGPKRWGLHIALGAVLAGALGNFWDRLLFGAVRDLLHLFPGVRLPFGWNWPDGSNELYPWIFNIADVALVLGAIVLAFLIYRSEREDSKQANETG